jgi:hypothetical protein
MFSHATTACSQSLLPQVPAFQGERKPGSPPTNENWEDKLSLLGRTLRWGEDASGHGWATAGPAMFVCSAAKPQEMVLAILAAMAYKSTAH